MGMADERAGIRTFLFTDIEGSTRLWDRYPGTMPIALARHDKLLRRVITAHHGIIFKTVGDAVYAVFADSAAALAATLAAQRALKTEDWAAAAPSGDSAGPFPGLRVRMVLHRGP